MSRNAMLLQINIGAKSFHITFISSDFLDIFLLEKIYNWNKIRESVS